MSSLALHVARLCGVAQAGQGEAAPPTSSVVALERYLASHGGSLSGDSNGKLESPPHETANDEDHDSDSETARLLGPSLWADLLDAASTLEAEDAQPDIIARHADGMETDAAAAIPDTSASPAIRLHRQLTQTHADAAVASSVMDSVLQALTSKASKDEISAQLAETVGFEHLDLVSDLVADVEGSAAEVQRITQASSASTSAAPSAPQTSSHTPDYSLAPENHADLRPTAKPYTPGSQVRVQTKSELAIAKIQRAEHRRLQRQLRAGEPGFIHGSHSSGASTPQLSLREMEQLRLHELEANASRPLYTSAETTTDAPRYPHVFSSGASGNTLSVFGSKFALPAGTTRREASCYEEVTIPPPKQLPMRLNERLVPIGEMDPICRGAFPGYTCLNRLQSVVYPLGYRSNENLLVCAPTGAGKTDVAMLTVLRCISQYSASFEPTGGKGAQGFGIRTNDFKIIYVAPMKALAAEVVRKFSKRLSYLGVKVRELTGDMQMTRQEINETQMIVTTPEKWDVVTRKPTGEGELAQKVRLLIIDEVHLLHEDRGAVIETIVARTLRLVESSQSLIRIVGLSATLPNYVDVADFLRVNRYKGLFYFDSSFRPVPLEQHFLGVRGKPGTQAARNNLDKATFEKVAQLLREGHQIMIFVHARKETVKTALTMRDMCRGEALEELMLEGRDQNSAMVGLRRDLQQSRNREMKELFESGFGIHHAGMLRSDRTLSERMFESGLTRVLCCTSTLAWGVNLPAYAVLIKGTEVYDSSMGKFTDLSILDVLQIFGRAGRPQYEDLGVGYICTNQDKLSHYIDAITSQHPIESKFSTGLVNALNAEVALGTVASIRDGVSWLSYTYMFTRMKRNPLAYGMKHEEVAEDPHLGAKRLTLITGAARRLVACQMMELDDRTGQMTITDLGRVAARYYIGANTIEVWLEKMRPRMSEADVLHLVSLAADFEQIIPRDTESQELKRMQEKAPCEIPGGFETPQGKVNLLLQAYISRTYVEDFALVSDSGYVAQNAGRNIRALLEMALSRKWAPVSSALLSMSKAVERRMWPFDHPLSAGQSGLSGETVFNLTRWADEVEVSELAGMTAAKIGDLIHLNERMGGSVRQAALQFPNLTIEPRVQPIAHDLLRIEIAITKAFRWNDSVHSGGSEPFVVWIEDKDGVDIIRWARVNVRRGTTTVKLSFAVPVSLPAPEGLNIRWISDRWVGSDGECWIDLTSVRMPPPPPPHQALLDLPLLPVSASLRGSIVEAQYAHAFAAFNATQTQAFHSLMHTRSDVLFCAPTVSGKSTLAEMAIWRQLRLDRAARALVVAPSRALLVAQAESFQRRFADLVGIDVRVAKTPRDFLQAATKSGASAGGRKPLVLFTLPGALLRAVAAANDGDEEGAAAQVLDAFQLVIAEDLHQLDAIYELALSAIRLRSETNDARIVATSASVADVSGLASWLEIKETALYSFSAADRASPLQLSFEGFDMPHSAALFKSMAKPTYDHLREAMAKHGRAIVFVSSRGQCLGTAQELVRRMASELDVASFLGGSEDEVESHLAQRLRDPGLAEPLLAGVGIVHSNLLASDLNLTLELYERGLVKLLVAAREACWTLDTRANLVILMGTQYVRVAWPIDGSRGGGPNVPLERQVLDYSLDEILRMQGFAVQPDPKRVGGAGAKCVIMAQSDAVPYLQRMLSSGLPVESQLLDNDSSLLLLELVRRMARRGVKAALAIDGVVDFLAGTYLGHQIYFNPSFYGAKSQSEEDVRARLSEIGQGLLEELIGMHCARDADGNSGYVLTPLGRSLAREPASLLGLRRLVAIRNGAAEEQDDEDELAAAHAEERAAEEIANIVKSCGALPPAPKKGGPADSQEEDKEAYEALRHRTPSLWLTAFAVPRVKRAERKGGKKGGKDVKADASKDAKADGEVTGEAASEQAPPAEEEVAAEAPTTTTLSQHHARLLLLASFFAGKKVSQLASIGKDETQRLQDRQDALVIDVARALAGGGGSGVGRK